jgi:hypothetical protein
MIACALEVPRAAKAIAAQMTIATITGSRFAALAASLMLVGNTVVTYYPFGSPLMAGGIRSLKRAISIWLRLLQWLS